VYRYTHIFTYISTVHVVHLVTFGDSQMVASVSRIDKMIGLFCKRDLQKRQYSAKETNNLIDPTHHSHPIVHLVTVENLLRSS